MIHSEKRIIPSAPFKSLEEIENLSNKVRKVGNRIQVDVCDGEFVKSVSWPFTDFTKADLQNLGKKVDLDVFLPNWEEVNYSFDLMVEHPEKYLETFAAYGVDEVVIHYRSIPTDKKVAKEVWGKIFAFCDWYDIHFVLAIDVKTDFNSVKKFIQEHKDKIDAVQVMGIENIGFQGQSFSSESLEIVEVLKTLFGEVNIYFDGGINEETIEEVVLAGVDTFCVGSFLTQSDSFLEDYKFLKKEIANLAS
jgi:pentose-5-phosphate-3-epimerase